MSRSRSTSWICLGLFSAADVYTFSFLISIFIIMTVRVDLTLNKLRRVLRRKEMWHALLLLLDLFVVEVYAEKQEKYHHQTYMLFVNLNYYLISGPHIFNFSQVMCWSSYPRNACYCMDCMSCHVMMLRFASGHCEFSFGRSIFPRTLMSVL